MRDIRPVALSAMVAFLLSAEPAFAYVGPGAGLSAIGSILALLSVIVLMIAGFVWYPIKRVIGHFRKPATESDEAGTK